ncbi:allantoinase AllB [Actinospica sp. MGRD01-02]|uniref:allantoinase n=1 Tax=Actinospica acidithermotolerans TaxID=2828514 RepID=A0A941ECX9_9ACTN|nr:allantoinase AllB [Actinospica acidithermotolerans]MBR7829146.1 allantoinase AllB [Actinospica acidithermotolerans]
MSHDLVVRSEAVHTPQGPKPGAVVVDGERITSVLPVDAPVHARREVVLPRDEVLIPGVVDTHVHVNEPGRTEWEGFATATAAAAAGGVTTIIDMPLNSVPPTTTPEALAVKRKAADGACSVDVGFWGGAVPQSLGHLAALHLAGVFGFKAFLSPSGVPEFEHLSAQQLTAAAAEIKDFDGLLIVHAEDPHVLAEASSATVVGRGYGSFAASRPDTAEVAAIENVIKAAHATGARVHILHLSSAAALPRIAEARSEGVRITVETCPHYLAFAEAEIPPGATQFKCCPPIRSAENRDLLWQGLQDGVIDIIASDHSPATAELKLAGGGDFERAWGGIAGLQVALPAVWTAAASRGIPLGSVLEWMSAGTSRLVGLADRGRIEQGARADLVAFAPNEPVRVAASALLHRNPVSAYDGARLIGAVRRTWLAGAEVFGPSPDQPPTPRGRLLERGSHR